MLKGIAMFTPNYPRNYFDPYSEAPRAQCTECGNYFAGDDEITDVVEVNELDGSVLYQGICTGCKVDETE